MKARTGTKKELKSIMELPALLFVSCYNASKEVERLSALSDTTFPDVYELQLEKATNRYVAYMDLIESAKLCNLYNQFLKTM